MDARAFRLEWPAGIRVFEVDRDDVFTHKEAVLARLQAKASCDRRVVRQDLAKPWKDALIQAGFDASRKAAFLDKLAELGCPWKSSIADPDTFMAERGWRSTPVFPGEPEAHYGRWLMPVIPRNMPGIPRMFFLRATRTAHPDL
jgi:O-methyltransferase involved in polyketide biosynthesis